MKIEVFLKELDEQLRGKTKRNKTKPQNKQTKKTTSVCRNANLICTTKVWILKNCCCLTYFHLISCNYSCISQCQTEANTGVPSAEIVYHIPSCLEANTRVFGKGKLYKNWELFRFIHSTHEKVRLEWDYN